MKKSKKKGFLKGKKTVASYCYIFPAVYLIIVKLSNSIGNNHVSLLFVYDLFLLLLQEILV